MEINSAVCTSLEQSERLLALGLKKETADMYYFWVNENDCRIRVDVDNNPLKYNAEETFTPAWSLHRLIVLSGMCIIEMTTDNFYDKVIHYIEFLIKFGDFNKDYLEE